MVKTGMDFEVEGNSFNHAEIEVIMKKMLSTAVVIGITGGIGSGKSFVIERICSLYKALFIHADAIAKEQMSREGCSYQNVLNAFGKEILDDKQEIDRKKLAAIVFHDPDALLRLNKITHPPVMTEVEKMIKEAKQSGRYKIILLESAMLTEAGYKKFCDEVWYIYASVDTRKKRLVKSRAMQESEIDAIIGNQADATMFEANTDKRIPNDTDTDQKELDRLICQNIENLLKDSSNTGNHTFDMV